MNQQLLDIIRNTYPSKIVEELSSVQPINISAEDLGKACDVLAAMHNLNHPDDNWPTSLEAKVKTDEAQEASQ